MKISPVCNFKHKTFSQKLNFTSSWREVYKEPKTGNIVAFDSDFSVPESYKFLYSNYTCFLRDDVPLRHRGWSGFAELLDKEFKEADKVNIYDFGCSDGSEAYSLAISLIETLGEERAQKFLPIKASDADKNILNIAKSGELCCTSEDKYVLNRCTNYNLSKYFDVSDAPSVLGAGPRYILKPKDIIKSAVTFERKVFPDALDEIEPENSLVLCRNFWPYMSNTRRHTAVDKLKSTLGQSSRFVIGDYDYGRYGALFADKNFEEVHFNFYKVNKGNFS